MERVKSNVGKGFGWENPINLMDAGCQIRLGEGIWMGKSYKLHRFGWGNPTNYIDVGCLGFKIFVKNEDFKFQVKYNVKIS